MICSGMTWSYSRIKTFEDCRYAFFLKYILALDSKPQFFSAYGSLVHDLLAGYYSGEIGQAELVPSFISRYCNEVPVFAAPKNGIASGYFRQAVSYFQEIKRLEGRILAIEQKFDFITGDFPFTGIIDLLIETPEGELWLVDHKSRNLSQRSTRKKPTKNDEVLDSYLRQLYLYSIPINESVGRRPDKLAFNCYRTGELVVEPFSDSSFNAAQAWAAGCIDEIISCRNWCPNIDFFRCRYLCDMNHECEYFALQGGGVN